MFTITRQWLIDNKTERGAWTKDQIESLGIEWPPTSGWIIRIVGKGISLSNKELFERAESKLPTKVKRGYEKITTKQLIWMKERIDAELASRQVTKEQEL